jgi:tripartite-type tricarboxylate transporter receptor subunit TctC
MWDELERNSIPVMVLIHQRFMPMIDAIAAKHPRLKFVIDHLGLVNGEKDDVAFRGLDQLLALGKRPNVAVKSSALPCYTAEPYPYPGPAEAPEARPRRVRQPARFLGHRPITLADSVPAGGRALHEAHAFPHGGRPRMDHGKGNSHMARLAALKHFMAFAAASLCACAALAQPFPNRPVKIVVPFAPGGNLDVTARLVGEHMAKTLGQPVVVENRAGAGRRAGKRGGGEVRARWLYARHRDHRTIVVSPLLIPNPPYQLSNFAAVGLMAVTPLVLEVPAASPHKDFRSYLAYVKANPGKVTIGHSGNGTTNHIAILQLQDALKVDWVAVPYKGSGPALIDLMGGQIDSMIDQTSSSLVQIQAGKLRALAVGTRSRIADLPNVPTLQEQGVADFEAVTPERAFRPRGHAAGRDSYAGWRAQQGARGSGRAQEARRAGLGSARDHDGGVRPLHARGGSEAEEARRLRRAQAVARFSKERKSPSAGETRTASTRACSGPRRAHAVMASTASGLPWTTASTLPSRGCAPIPSRAGAPPPGASIRGTKRPARGRESRGGG